MLNKRGLVDLARTVTPEERFHIAQPIVESIVQIIKHFFAENGKFTINVTEEDEYKNFQETYD